MDNDFDFISVKHDLDYYMGVLMQMREEKSILEDNFNELTDYLLKNYDCADDHLNKLMKKCSLEISKIVERIEVIEACVIRLQKGPNLNLQKQEKAEQQPKEEESIAKSSPNLKSKIPKALNTYILASEFKNFCNKNGITIKYFSETVLKTTYTKIKYLINRPLCWSSLKSERKIRLYRAIDAFLKDKKMQKKFIGQAGLEGAASKKRCYLEVKGKTNPISKRSCVMRKAELKEIFNFVKLKSLRDADVCEQIGIATLNIKWFLQRACMSLKYLKHSERAVVDKILKWYMAKNEEAKFNFKPTVNNNIKADSSAVAVVEQDNSSMLVTKRLKNFFKLNAFPTPRMIHAMANFLQVSETLVINWYDYQRGLIYKALKTMSIEQYREFRVSLAANPNPDKNAITDIANRLRLPFKFLNRRIYTQRDAMRQVDKVYYDVLNECNSGADANIEVKGDADNPSYGFFENGIEVQLSDVVVKTEIDFVEPSEDSEDSVQFLPY